MQMHSPDQVLASIQARLCSAAANRRDGWRTPAVALVGTDGSPSVRTVVLRKAQSDRLVFHTDSRSEKWAALLKKPTVAWCFWDVRTREQLRIVGSCELHENDAVSAVDWSRLGPKARAGYQIDPAPGTPINAAEAFSFDDSHGSDHFAVVHCKPIAMDWLKLGRPHHQRARFNFEDGDWFGQWLVP